MTDGPIAPTIRFTGGLLSVALLGCLALPGCFGDRADLPDPTNETRIRAEEIDKDIDRRQEAERAELARREQELAFRAEQTKAKALNDVEQSELQRDRELAPLADEEKRLDAERDQHIAAAKAERDEKLRTAAGEDADRLRADADARLAVLAQEDAQRKSQLAQKRSDLLAKERERSAGINAKRDEELANIAREREQVRLDHRERMLAIERDRTSRLDALAKDSKGRMDETSQKQNEALERDRGIAHGVRKALDEDRSASADVSYAVSAGIVTLKGSVTDEARRSAIVQRVGKVDGVQRIDDRLTVR